MLQLKFLDSIKCDITEAAHSSGQHLRHSFGANERRARLAVLVLSRAQVDLKLYSVGLVWHNVFLFWCKSKKNLWNKVLGSKKTDKKNQ